MATEALDQRLINLTEANRIRLARATIKRRWKRIDPRTARREMCEFIMAPPDDLLNWRIETALMAIPWVGRVKVRYWLMECRIPMSKSLGSLSDRQRIELVEKVSG